MRKIALIVALLAGLAYVLSRQYGDEPDAPMAVTMPESRTPDYVVTEDTEREAPMEMAPRPTFGGYPCSDDCSTHVAGFYWAEEHSISDPDNCEGATGAFIEGCRVYAESRGEVEATGALEPGLYIAQR